MKQDNFTLLKEIFDHQTAVSVGQAIKKRIEKYFPGPSHSIPSTMWTERDVFLICYGDHVHEEGRTSLEALRVFLEGVNVAGLISGIHVLPFFPYTSDDGFSVVDYYKVNPQLGGWEDIEQLSRQFGLMYDFVLNHISASSEWFKEFQNGNPQFRSFFITPPGDAELSGVLRPRATPLLTEYPCGDKMVKVWTTFSADQIDVNFSDPNAFVEMIDVFLFYLAKHPRGIRLDAVNYVWKEIGTSCSHLPQAHAIVKYLRSLTDAYSPGTLLVSETNVPHKENVTYLGNSDEAHMVYNFSLPPLLIESMLSGDTTFLNSWAELASESPAGTTFFNFIASHDGIGLRPLIGLLPQERIQKLVNHSINQGGLVSTRSNPDGSESPYELNVTIFEILGDNERPLSDEHHILRFLTSQAICLAFRGIPGIYFQSLFGKRDYLEGVQATGRNRTINRQKFERQELYDILSDRNLFHGIIFERMKHLLSVRRSSPAFHPEAPQQILDLGNSHTFGFVRGTGANEVRCISNFSHEPQTAIVQKDHEGNFVLFDLIKSREVYGRDGHLVLRPYETLWLKK